MKAVRRVPAVCNGKDLSKRKVLKPVEKDERVVDGDSGDW